MVKKSFFLPLLAAAWLVGCSGTSGPDTLPWYRPAADSSWQWQLSGPVNTAYEVDLYDIDLFDTPSSVIDQLHREGRRVICYFSAGSYEAWRSDALAFPPESLGEEMDGWDERWIDIRNDGVRTVMLDRLALAKAKGCDGVEPDNVDGYTNETGFPLGADDQLDYNRFLSREAHRLGLFVGLKNDLDQIPSLEGDFDFALNEQCHVYDECEKLLPFIEAGKPVFVAEYADKYRDNTDGARDRMCEESRQMGLHTLVLPLELDDRFRYSCDQP